MIGTLLALVTGALVLIARLPSPLHENLMGLMDAVMHARIIWPLAFIAAAPALLLLGPSTPQQYLLLFTYFAGTGFALLWSGHRFDNPAHWIKGSLLSWRADGAIDGDQDLIPRFSALWRRRLGLALLGLAVPVTTAVAVAQWLSA